MYLELVVLDVYVAVGDVRVQYNENVLKFLIPMLERAQNRQNHVKIVWRSERDLDDTERGRAGIHSLHCVLVHTIPYQLNTTARTRFI